MLRIAPVLVAGVVAAAGCGGASDFVRDRDGTLQITLDEYRLRPENVRVRPGRVHIVARNHGRLTHNLKIHSLRREEGQSAFVYGGTETAHPGETVTTDLQLRPGKYRIVCTIANHDDLGQFGELQVGQG